MRKTGGIGFLLAGYAGVGGMLAMEQLLRGTGNAASMKDAGEDQHTTRDLVAAIAIASCAPPVLRLLPFGRLPKAFGAIGLGVQLAGLATRAWSMRSLGSFYSRTLRVEDEQHVVDTGPYQWVRHPGYAGSMLVWLGFALASRSLPAVVLVTGLFGMAYRRRIRTEELLLRRDLPGYVEYSERTARLAPYVW